MDIEKLRNTIATDTHIDIRNPVSFKWNGFEDHLYVGSAIGIHEITDRVNYAFCDFQAIIVEEVASCCVGEDELLLDAQLKKQAWREAENKLRVFQKISS